MFELLNIEYKGYAAATTGGVAFIVNVETSKERFPSIKEGMVRLSLTVPLDQNEEIDYHIVSRLINSKGEISHWGEEEELTEKEHFLVKKWCLDHDIKKQARDLASEYEKQYKLFFTLSEKMENIFTEEMPDSIEKMKQQQKRLQDVRKQYEEAFQKMEDMKNIKVS
jgi:hypothetical protein